MQPEAGSGSENTDLPVWTKWKTFAAIDKFFRHIEDWLNLASVFIIMFLMFFATAEIIGRYFFNHPIHGHLEIVELIMAGVVFFGVAYTERTGGHVRMELFVTKVLRGRSYHLAEFITTTAALVTFIFIFYYTTKSSWDAYQFGDTTPDAYIPTWPSKFAIPLGSLFLCIRFFIEMIQHLAQVIVGGEFRNISLERLHQED
jgi:TRAP-type C4-dicarboxylate transport system permease small subunit